jgi:hypothetical protein
MDGYGRLHGHTPAIVTGQPLELGGDRGAGRGAREPRAAARSGALPLESMSATTAAASYSPSPRAVAIAISAMTATPTSPRRGAARDGSPQGDQHQQRGRPARGVGVPRLP